MVQKDTQPAIYEMLGPNPASWWMWKQKTLSTDDFTLTLWFRGPAHRSQGLRGRKRPTLVLKEPGDERQRREQRLSENVFDILSTAMKKQKTFAPTKRSWMQKNKTKEKIIKSQDQKQLHPPRKKNQKHFFSFQLNAKHSCKKKKKRQVHVFNSVWKM